MATITVGPQLKAPSNERFSSKEIHKPKAGEVAPTPEKVKKSKKSKDELDKKNLADTAQEIKSKEPRESMYIYPADCKDKKKFRRDARAKAEKFAKDMEKMESDAKAKDSKEHKALQKEFAAWKKEIYTAA